ncbi:peptidase M1 [Actinoplanes sp. SE50]|uniref:M1 family metallopeptidase n=1 Tax=unclassified Actinoplanes TaxID=2626549 RepID=UPI00023EDF19|nr:MULTISPECIES: M1 family metallopeptidase [unclassified Actinoplanes]AEV88266.1 Glutamyl aminopeptidase [Actinoplanes sp. SE50/110]ATO86671.1 peptidase M1 [Actinoplanes sp. SE50]SLM04089.1 peptidase M1 [Actinoplanes sp. SE50/110]
MHRYLAVVALGATVLCAGCTDKAAPPAVATASQPAAAPAIDYTAWQGGKSVTVADRLYPEHGNAGLDVLHYDLKLDWQPTSKVLTGTATLQIRPVTAASEISLDFANLAVDKVTVDGRPATGTLAKDKLTVPATLTAEQPVTLVVDYHGTPRQVAYPSHRGDAAEGVGLRPTRSGGLWTMQEPWGAMTWYPANELVSDKALYDIAVTVPQGWAAAASGTPGPVEGTTYHYSSAAPTAAYLTTLAVDRFRKTSQTGAHGLKFTYWTVAKTDDRLLTELKKSPQLVSWLEAQLGPYPFDTAGAVLSDSVSAMETQQMLSIGRQATGQKFDPAYFDEILVHEYAHQWFGDAVTPSDWTDLWLNEGFAQYMQYLYEQKVYKLTDAQLETFLRQQDARLRKSVGPPGKPKAANFAESNVYRCTAAMLKQLNDALGDKKFFDLMKAWVAEHKGTNQDRAAFTAFVREKTGTDYSKLIDSWLDSPSTPK